jgi:uncharacterized protein (TIGR02266 family)
MTRPEDRRKDERVDARFDVRFARVEDAARALRTFSVNVSAGGLCLRSQRPHEQGARVRLQMEIANESFDLEGIVTWTREVPDSEAAHVVGVRFINLSPEDRERLKQVVQRLKR